MKTIMPVLALLLVFYSLHSQQIIANDCSKLLKLCNKESFKIDFLAGPGQDVSELESVSCYRKPFPESNSVWLTWQIESPGNLEFSIIPFDEQDDFDFILFKANAEFNKCNDKMELRCMASGENIGDTHNTIRCLGITGLKQGASDKSRSQGCSTLEDNFLESISALKNEIYIL